MYSNKKMNWNNKKINLSKDQITDLVSFQKALDGMGIDDDTFMKSTTV